MVEVRTHILCLKYNLIFIARVRRSTVDKSDRVASKCIALRLVVEVRYGATAENCIDSVPTRMAILG